MIPHIVLDKISDSKLALPAGVVITGYGGYKILKKQYASGISWGTTGIGIIMTALAAKKVDVETESKPKSKKS